MSEISEEGPGGEGGGHQATPEAEEKKVYTQRQWTEERWKWLCRVWGMASLPFAMILGIAYAEDFVRTDVVAVGVGGVAVCFWFSGLYWWRYGRATGKWFWL